MVTLFLLLSNFLLIVANNNYTCEVFHRVLITGITGMIGSHLARAMLRRNGCFYIVGIVRLRSDLTALAGILNKIELVYGDITDSKRMSDVFMQVKPSLVFHFAAQAINAVSFSMPQLTLDANIQGTLNVLEAVRSLEKIPRVLVAGSSTEYGRAADTHVGPISENVILDPVSPYGVSKFATEKLAYQYFISHGVKAVTARLFIHVGVGGTDSLAIHQFCKQIVMAELGIGPDTIYHGNLETKRDMTDASDSASALIDLAIKGKPGEAYNVGSGTDMTIQTLLNLAVSHSTNKNLKTAVDVSRLRSFDEKVLVANIDKLRQLTGWTPRPNMELTVLRILDYWRSKVHTLYCYVDFDSENSPCNTPHNLNATKKTTLL